METGCSPGFLNPSTNLGRHVCYGYRSREIAPLVEVSDVDTSHIITKIRESELGRREPVQVSLGCHVPNATLPHADPGDSKTMVDGVKKRMITKMPKMSEYHRIKFRKFVLDWLHKKLKPLSPDSDVSVEHWLESTTYPLYRRLELLRKNHQIVKVICKYLRVKSFMKDETYITYKHARGINSRTDEFKTLVGPIFKLIEKELFSLPYFIKKVPVTERPQFIIDMIHRDGHKYMATDFTSFEAHFDELMEDCEFQLYEYMTQNLATGTAFMNLIREALLGVNCCDFKWLNVEVYRRRMSGEMCTSLGNGFTNLMLILYMFSQQNIEPNVVVEGDDGLTGFPSECTPPSQELIKELGLKLKLEEVENVCEASFCGNVFDMSDKLVVTEPITEIVSFGWTTSRYLRSKEKRHMELLRSKSLSLLYQYRGNPILTSLALYGLRVTEGYRARAPVMNEYQREEFARMTEDIKKKGLPVIPPPHNTRALVERLYGIDVHTQKQLEDYFNNLTTLTPLSHPAIINHSKKVWSHYDYHYSLDINRTHDPTSLFPSVVATGAIWSDTSWCQH